LYLQIYNNDIFNLALYRANINTNKIVFEEQFNTFNYFDSIVLKANKYLISIYMGLITPEYYELLFFWLSDYSPS